MSAANHPCAGLLVRADKTGVRFLGGKLLPARSAPAGRKFNVEVDQTAFRFVAEDLPVRLSAVSS